MALQIRMSQREFHNHWPIGAIFEKSKRLSLSSPGDRPDERLAGSGGGRIKVTEVGTLIGLGRRQVYRLAKAYHHRGSAALISRRGASQSDRSDPTDVRATPIEIIRERYSDFGPTMAAEKLAELHGICLARETVRQLSQLDSADCRGEAVPEAKITRLNEKIATLRQEI